jgi:hypothetical protein
MKKNTSYSISITASAIFLLSSGCAKQEEPSALPAGQHTTLTTTPSLPDQNPASTSSTNLPTATTNSVTEADLLAQKQVAEAQAALDKAAAAAQKTAETGAASSQDQVKALFEKIKGLVAEKKYAEAVVSLNEVSQMKLTTEQQGWVEQMKTQVQKGMASQVLPDAAKTLDGFLNKK